MRALLLTALALTAFSPFCRADESSMRSFFSALEGSRTGKGKVVSHLGHGGVYAIQVEQKTILIAPDQWQMETKISGLPGVTVPTLTTYILKGDVLTVSSTQYTDKAQAITSDINDLSFKTLHTDPVTGIKITLSRSMHLNSDGSDHVLSDITQGQKLVEHFDYTVN